MVREVHESGGSPLAESSAMQLGEATQLPLAAGALVEGTALRHMDRKRTSELFVKNAWMRSMDEERPQWPAS